MKYLCAVPSPLGRLTLASDGISITGLWMEGQKYYAATLEQDTREQSLPVFDRAREWLGSYFSGKNPACQLPLAPEGSPFRLLVWNILRNIPYGQVITYGEIAKQLESLTQQRVSAQAVGGAVGHNPISIVIPCHRVVGSDGSLTGYAGGIQAKVLLLQLEGVSMDRLYIPKKGTAL